MKTIFLLALVGLAASASVYQADISGDEFGINEYIVGGQDSDIKRHPYIVATFTSSYTCCGSIVAPNWILSAAHCGPRTIQWGVTVRTGSGSNVEEIDQLIRHPNYRSYEEYDIALYKLKRSITYSDVAQPVKLPPPNYEVEGSWTTDFWAIGWGYTSSSGGALPTTLQEVVLKVVSNDDCARIHAPTSYKILPSHICVGVQGGGKSECNGDSGSPGVSNGYQVGICSWSIKPCANPTYPGVFTKVSHYIDFIESTTQLKRSSEGYLV